MINFTDVIQNEGEGYDNVTGVFTAPVDGVYLFSVQLCPYSHQETFYAITVDGMDVVHSAQEGRDVHACVTFQALTSLRVLNKVWVTCLDQGGEIYQTSNHWNSFTGILLS